MDEKRTPTRCQRRRRERPERRRSTRPTLSHWVAYIAVRLAVCLVQALSMDACRLLARLLAWISHDLLRLRRQVTDENLRHAFPHWPRAYRDQVARAMWQHVFLMVCELAHVPRKLHDTNWRDFVRMSPSDTERFVRHLLSERPVVMVSGHLGNFEVGGVIAGLLGFPTYTVARPLDNPLLHKFITRFRQATGQYMLPKRGSAATMDAILRQGRTLVLLGDQFAGPKGCWVEFFGRRASCHKAVALFSLVNRAPMLLVYSRRDEKPMRFCVGIEAEFDPQNAVEEYLSVPALTQWYSRHLERTVRRTPEQYWWLHRRWKIRPPKRRGQRRPRAA